MAKALPLLSTYRLQLHAAFPLAAAIELVPYLARLGISHVYASPLLQARRGSTHGYDVVDPTRLNPELGTERGLEVLARQLRRHGMGLLLDIVPNHMGTGSENPAWEDVLEHGLASPFARWFDIEWYEEPGDPVRPIFLPVLGARLSQVLARGEIELVAGDRGFRVRYFDHSFPLEPVSVGHLLRRAAAKRGRSVASSELEEIAQALEELPGWKAHGATGRREQAVRSQAQLAVLWRRSSEIRRRLELVARDLSRDPVSLKALLLRQPYRLAHWRRAARRLNYRRFFDINDLIAVRQEDPDVFAATHERIRHWLEAGRVDALRVDHVDGLRDPEGYLRSLQVLAASSSLPVYVEKILGPDEKLPDSWPVEGTTGYEFLNQLDAIFISPDGFRRIEEWYRRRIFRRDDATFRKVVRSSKRAMLEGRFRTDVSRLVRLLQAVLRDEKRRVIPASHLQKVIVEAITCLPVYRTYVSRTHRRPRATDRVVMKESLQEVRQRRRATPSAVRFLEDVFSNPEASPARLRFIERFQQTSGPAMAKGLEDTAHYVYVPLASRNEVGGAPDEPLENAVKALHAANTHRARHWPRILLSTDTHDTKRSADVRARLNALSEIPEKWISRVERWRRLNAPLRRRVGRRLFPDANTEYLLYQTLVGTWPRAGIGKRETVDLRQRVQAYMLKATREAKVHTSWRDPEAEFETALEEFVDDVLSSPAFLAEVESFVERISRAALWTSLARTLIHLTAPGVPDLYQGTDQWSFALVDPDNRRPVDYDQRRALLDEVEHVGRRRSALSELLRAPEDGGVKLHVIKAALRLRRRRPDLFLRGSYEPLRGTGAKSEHIFASARRLGDEAAIIVAPRQIMALADDTPVGKIWNDTRLILPRALAGRQLKCLLSGQTNIVERQSKPPALALGHVLAVLPVSLLVT